MMVDAGRGENDVSVSYTHLDVYKRQVAQLSGAVRVYHQTERLYSTTDYREVTLSRFLRDPPHTLQYDHTLTEKMCIRDSICAVCGMPVPRC